VLENTPLLFGFVMKKYNKYPLKFKISVIFCLKIILKN